MTLLSKLTSLKGGHVLFSIGPVPATSTKPAHEIILTQCFHCKSSKAWVAWGRVRGHLSGDGTKALCAGVQPCTAVPRSIAAKFSEIIDQGHATSASRVALAKGRRAVETAEAKPQTKYQRTIDKAFNTMSREMVDAAVANCFYGNGISSCNLSFCAI